MSLDHPEDHLPPQITPPRPHERCDKCGTPVSEWETTPCVKSLTQSPRHTITRFYLTPDDE